MKNNKILILMVLCYCSLVGQTQQGIVWYKKSIEREKPTKSAKENIYFEDFQNINKKIDELLKDTEFSLKFKGKVSFFQVVNSLALKENNFTKLALVPNGNCRFYNTKNDRLSKVNIFGEDFLVIDKQLNWQLKNETKKIGNYLCYKAIAIEKKLYRGVMKDYPIIAWYCPEINASFGPIGVSGLPGLILEVNKGKIIYTATKINLSTQKNIEIKKLTKGRKITREKLGEMIDEAMGNFKKNKGY